MILNTTSKHRHTVFCSANKELPENVSHRPRVWYPEFSETAKKDSWEFRVLEKEEFNITDFIVGEIETTYTVQTWCRRKIILKVQFESGKIGFITLENFVQYWNENLGYAMEEG